MARRVLWPAALSLGLYFALFGTILDRPLSLGLFRALIAAKLARAAAIQGPKLVILAGSTGPYSHRCETIEARLAIPCVNGGIAVGIGLDYLFARWKPLLHPGDTVYLPLEEAQYAVSRAANALGPDAAIMARHERAILAGLTPERWVGAAFAFAPRAGVMSLIEMTLTEGGFRDPRGAYGGTVNAWGDMAGHTPDKGAGSRLLTMTPVHRSAGAIAAGHGTAILRDFIDWARGHGIRIVGGLPPAFADSPIPDDTTAAIHAVFTDAGARFADLGDSADWPRTAFFDSPDHLNEPAQIARSARIAEALQVIMAPAREARR